MPRGAAPPQRDCGLSAAGTSHKREGVKKNNDNNNNNSDSHNNADDNNQSGVCSLSCRSRRIQLRACAGARLALTRTHTHSSFQLGGGCILKGLLSPLCLICSLISCKIKLVFVCLFVFNGLKREFHSSFCQVFAAI